MKNSTPGAVSFLVANYGKRWYHDGVSYLKTNEDRRETR
jgi:hypothetical protein